MVQHDFIGFGEREYVDRRTGATLKVLWADIRESKTTGLAVMLKSNIENQLRKASKATSRPSELCFVAPGLHPPRPSFKILFNLSR